MEIVDLLRFVNARHGTAFELRGYLEGGTRGAWEVAAPGGRRAVLKRGWGEHLGRIRPVVDALRARGYPTPRLLLGGRAPDGGSYHVQEWAPGAPVARLTPALLRQIVDLIELQADLRPDTDPDWSAYARAVVFEGESGWATALRPRSGATAAPAGPTDPSPTRLPSRVSVPGARRPAPGAALRAAAHWPGADQHPAPPSHRERDAARYGGHRVGRRGTRWPSGATAGERRGGLCGTDLVTAPLTTHRVPAARKRPGAGADGPWGGEQAIRLRSLTGVVRRPDGSRSRAGGRYRRRRGRRPASARPDAPRSAGRSAR